MRSIGVYEAKTRLASLLHEVESGQSITITRHGRPVAVLMPASPLHAERASAAIDAIRRLRRGNRLDGLSVRELVEEGRR